MFKLNLKIALRNLLKYKSYVITNIVGLSIGLAGFVFIVLFINYEKSYDTWHPDLENVYQVQEYSDHYPVEDDAKWKNNIDRRLSQLFSENPSLKAGATMVEQRFTQGLTIENGKAFLQDGMVKADSLFFKIMPYHFKYGDSETALKQPYSIVLKENIALKYFGNENPIGKTITIAGGPWNGSEDFYTVSGVISELKTPSVLDFQVLYIDDGRSFKFNGIMGRADAANVFVKIPEIKDLEQYNQALQNDYLELKEKHLQQFKSSVEEKVAKNQKPQIRITPISEVHQQPLEGESWLQKFKPVILLVVLLLLASLINFVNLSTANATSRAKEIGIRKVNGALRTQLVFQFLIEIFIQCTVALIVSLILLEISLPTLNRYFNLNLSLISNLNQFYLIGQLFGIIILITLLSGIYPSLYLSSFKPTEILKGNFSLSLKGVMVRKALLGVQFIITVGFIIGVILINKQINFLKNRDNGFVATQLINVRSNLLDYTGKGFYERLKAVDGVENVAYTSGVIGDNMPSSQQFKFDEKTVELKTVGLSFEGLEALGAKPVSGRLFTRSVEDSVSNVILNESAAKLWGGNIANKQILTRDSVHLNIVGVIKDIQVAGFEEAVEPSVYIIQSKAMNKKVNTYYKQTTLIRYQPAKIKNVITELNTIFFELNSFYPLKYSLVEEDFAQTLMVHERFEKLVSLFSILSLALSVFGLFSITAFLMKGKTKEIAIRKILGAERNNLLLLFNKGYFKIVLISNLIAFPIAYLLCKKWISSFAYQTDISVWPFVVAFILSILITILTVSFQSLKALKANPVKALKYE